MEGARGLGGGDGDILWRWGYSMEMLTKEEGAAVREEIGLFAMYYWFF